MPPNKPSAKPAGIHPDMKIECLPRKSHVVTFDDAVSALKLAPAANGIGAVLDAWTDPIGMHDNKVLEVEQAMLKEKDLVSSERVIFTDDIVGLVRVNVLQIMRLTRLT